MHKQLEKFLKETKTKYKTIEHKVVFTAHDAAATTKKKLSEIAKVVLIKADLPRLALASLDASRSGSGKAGKDLVLIVLPAGKYVDFSGIKKALKAKKVSMAKEKDIEKYLKTKIGLLHPFGNLYKLRTLLDKGFAKSKKLIASAGSYTESVELTIKDFERIVKPIKGGFSKLKR